MALARKFSSRNRSVGSHIEHVWRQLREFRQCFSAELVRLTETVYHAGSAMLSWFRSIGEGAQMPLFAMLRTNFGVEQIMTQEFAGD